MWTSRLFWKFFAVCEAFALVLLLPVLWSLLAWRFHSSGAGEALASDTVMPSWAFWLLPPLVVGGGLVAARCLMLVVASPIQGLTEAVRRARDTGSSAPLEVTRWDELGQLIDAFNRMQAEFARRTDELRQRNGQLSTVLDSMVEGVVAIDPREAILLANNSSRRLLDFSVADAVGRPLLEVTRSRPVHEAFLHTWSTQQPRELEFESPGKARRVLLLRTTRMPGDPCPGVLVVLHDVSELRRLENLRREFVANVSHELKTPLAAIKAYAETLRMGAVDDPDNNHMFVQRIEEQADRLHQLIVDLLQIARVESGKQAFDMRDLELGEIIRSCVLEYDELAGMRHIELQLEPASNPLLVHADEEGVRQIVGNLVDNAIKYTSPQGRIRVHWGGDGDRCWVEVRDNGIGIAEEHQPRVFERFFRVDKARSREMGGTGLGLAVVKHLAKAFGGSVGLTSRLGEGSTFRVELPLRNSSAG